MTKIMQTRAETNCKVRLCRVQPVFAALPQSNAKFGYAAKIKTGSHALRAEYIPISNSGERDGTMHGYRKKKRQNIPAAIVNIEKKIHLCIY